MSKVFKPARMNRLALPNRFIRSATWEGLAGEDGSCSPQLVKLIKELAKGRAGLIITGHAYVSRDGQATMRQLAIDDDPCIESLRRITTAVHHQGGRIMIQLSHGGLRADAQFSGTAPMGPSTGDGLLESPGREMTVADIRQVVDAFGTAARRAVEAGFDGLQIHAAHGYLLSQFLSPAFNRRHDDYGGSLERRARFLLEVYQRIRQSVGPDFPVFVKINSEDFLEEGLTPGDAFQVCGMLDNAGIDAVEISGGTLLSGKRLPFRRELRFERDQAYFRRAARTLKTRLQAPVILVGGIRSFFLAERLVGEGFADYLSMSRPFIREPHLIARWQAGDLRKATCISCNGCFAAARSGRGVYCVLDRKSTGKKGSEHLQA